MKATKILTVLTLILLVCSLVACNDAGKDKTNDGDRKKEIASLMAMEPKSMEEATKLHQDLMAQETAILSDNNALWEKVFLSANKGSSMIENGSNYGDFLLSTIEGAKDQFKADELKILRDGAQQIREIEGKLTILEQKYPGCGKKPSGDGASVPAENGKPAGKGDLMQFPAFEGKDLDGNDVKSSELFSGNTVTVVNFWFNGCKPCVEELDDLNALNEKVKAQGGEVVGINTETLDGNQQGIDAAKKLLETTGASYRNIYFASGSEAGKFALNIMAFPTTYVFDRDGNVVGQPLLGGIDKEENLAALQKNIDAALAKDNAK